MYLFWALPNMWSLNNFWVDKNGLREQKSSDTWIDAVYWSLRIDGEVLDKDKETFVVFRAEVGRNNEETEKTVFIWCKVLISSSLDWSLKSEHKRFWWRGWWRWPGHWCLLSRVAFPSLFTNDSRYSAEQPFVLTGMQQWKRLSPICWEYFWVYAVIYYV